MSPDEQAERFRNDMSETISEVAIGSWHRATGHLVQFGLPYQWEADECGYPLYDASQIEVLKATVASIKAILAASPSSKRSWIRKDILNTLPENGSDYWDVEYVHPSGLPYHEWTRAMVEAILEQFGL